MSATRRGVREKRWPPEVNSWVSEYAIAHPCFYIEELEEALRLQFPSLNNISASTICRALMHDLGLTRKEKRAREAAEFELRDYYRRLSPYYSYPDQLVFVDETSKDGRDSIRKYAWSKRYQKAIVDLPFSHTFAVTGGSVLGEHAVNVAKLVHCCIRRYFDGGSHGQTGSNDPRIIRLERSKHDVLVANIIRNSDR
ncbi:hypothetical protein DYB28_012592 [Aphanomyces astaci]|uniref:Tc1-like transposase DDE domain-containing protein n=1 Tax=Aphanomyces astaci TaxID=112090 RepID=A0A9X8H9A0_APHAT|nr:hypothetical protein DYB28_012592 [Aphanomyces astaci]